MSGAIFVLRAAAEFLESFEGLPEASVTCGEGALSVQFSHLPAAVMFPSVARVAERLGQHARAVRMPSGEWFFSVRGEWRGFQVTAFAASGLVSDSDRAREGGA
ncbi:hypothetical protein [Streptomyces litchfieldiae]|uniref:Uncharacterized protein n=1 Tax=Streptomyces litchfieldiae TaxID=3075543 RepID=A0ABU2N357_9ACTN|nr:hypothetical protein [Streptomyces sp. DSM 44938]MDT0347483.1 hypothetical protein [Streptomyces sp. DSM 44938]